MSWQKKLGDRKRDGRFPKRERKHEYEKGRQDCVKPFESDGFDEDGLQDVSGDEGGITDGGRDSEDTEGKGS